MTDRSEIKITIHRSNNPSREFIDRHYTAGRHTTYDDLRDIQALTTTILSTLSTVPNTVPNYNYSLSTLSTVPNYNHSPFASLYNFSIDDVNEILTQSLTEPQLRENPYIQIAVKKERADKDDFCSICQDNIKIGNDVCKLSCKHDFHYDCIDRWVKTKAMCPNCNEAVPIKDSFTRPPGRNQSSQGRNQSSQGINQASQPSQSSQGRNQPSQPSQSPQGMISQSNRSRATYRIEFF